MSRRVDTFKSTFGSPLTVNNFRVSIPRIDDRCQMIVQSTTFPTDKLRILYVRYFGETLGYPSLPENSHSWKCTIPEDSQGRAFKELVVGRRIWYEQYTGLLLLPTSLGFNIDVAMLAPDGSDLFKVKLWNAFIVGADPVQLSANGATTPFQWDIEFYFDWVQYNP